MSIRDKFRDQIHDRIKVLVLGDSGVGKSCLVNLICKTNLWSKPSWTIGCSIEILLHQFNEGTPNHRSCLIELWDIGGYKTHSTARNLFYQSYHGIILVHDLTNRKSYINLRKWLGEVLTTTESTTSGSTSMVPSSPPILNSTGYNMSSSSFNSNSFGAGINTSPLNTTNNYRDHSNISTTYSPSQQLSSSLSSPLLSTVTSPDEFDIEIFAGKNIPVLVVGTKKDLISQEINRPPRTSTLTEECGAYEIEINCLDNRAFAPGLTNCAELTRFFDKVIERKYTLSDRIKSNSLLFNSKRSYLD
ncbi:rab-like protein 3 [Panonychus citri]|uniref:rab-like protein 3 n=1 Tax=Panonychus citri TaxID=50023 RepID=UPI0023073FEA|nr:rab-like protein 3 [Panonychus citri]